MEHQGIEDNEQQERLLSYSLIFAEISSPSVVEAEEEREREMTIEKKEVSLRGVSALHICRASHRVRFDIDQTVDFLTRHMKTI